MSTQNLSILNFNQPLTNDLISKVTSEEVKVLQKLADNGNPEAQFRLSFLYNKGIGVQKNQAQGVQLLKKAAKQGHEDAKQTFNYIYWTYDIENYDDSVNNPDNLQSFCKV